MAHREVFCLELGPGFEALDYYCHTLEMVSCKVGRNTCEWLIKALRKLVVEHLVGAKGWPKTVLRYQDSAEYGHSSMCMETVKELGIE